MRSRLPFLDAAKGLGIALVVIGHARPPEWLNEVIYAFHMPLFFVLAGYTLRPPLDFGDWFARKLHRLLLPYLTVSFSLLALWLWAGRDILAGPDAPTTPQLLTGIAVGDPNLLLTVSASPLWFLPALVIALLVGLVVIAAAERSTRFIGASLAVLAAGCGLWLGSVADIWWRADVALAVQPLVYFGYLLREARWPSEDAPTWAFLGVGATLVLVWTLGIQGERVDIANRVYATRFSFYLTGVAGAVLTLQIGRALQRLPAVRAVFAALGRESLIILVLHQLVITATTVLVRDVFNGPQALAPYWHLLALVALVVPFLFAVVVLPWVPPLASLLGATVELQRPAQPEDQPRTPERVAARIG